MKKLISFMLAFLMIMPCVGIFASAKDNEISAVQNSDDVQGFIDDSLELINQAPDIIDVPIANNGGIDSEEDLNDDHDFETCRVIVESEEKPDKLNSLGIASGFMNYHIVQFANAEDTEKAFEYYSEQDDVISVFVDEIMSFSEVEVKEDTTIGFEKVPDWFNSWGADSTGFYELKDYLEKKNFSLEDVVVGVVDSGVDLDHEFFEGRLVRTYFNSSGRGQEDSEIEKDQSNGHGTMVSSVIVDSTPDNVKVAVYKTTTTLSSLSLACLQAVEDGVDIINASFGAFGYDEYADAYYWEGIVDYAYENDVVFVASAGNDGGNLDKAHHYPSDCKNAISAGAIDEYYMPTDFTNYGKTVDISAPGKAIPVAIPLNSYASVNGTSFSSPYTAALYAMYKSLYPDSEIDEITEAMKSNASSHSPYFTMHKGIDKLYGAGIIDAIGTSGLRRQAEVKVNIEPGDYDETISIELSSEGADEIYYTLDQTVPTKSNGILYEKPIKISSGGVVVKAIAYNEDKLSSEIFSGLYKVWEEAPEESFTIDENGTIRSYTGKATYIKVPETINGITAVSVGMSAFEHTVAEGVVLPETVTDLLRYSFNGDNDVKYVYGEGVKTIGYCAFGSSDSLIYVDLPNAEIAEEGAFGQTETLFGISLPKLKTAGYKTFERCKKMLYLNLPELESAGMCCFENSGNLYDVYVPKLNTITDMEQTSKGSMWFSEARVYNAVDLPSAEKIYELDFLSQNMENRVKRAEFSNLKQWRAAEYLYEPKSSDLVHTMVLPSTVEHISVGLSSHISGYIIYGSKGTYVEQWANEEDRFEITFIEITPETAVVTDLPECYKTYMGELVADVAGFNKQYQWYANTVDSNKGGTPIEGATTRSFDPADYPAPYYYCQVISTDKGYAPIVIKTSACKNMELAPVDFTLLENALKKVPKDLTIYDKGRDALERIAEEAKHPEGLTQIQVNGLAKELENAIQNLEKITVNLSASEVTLARGDTFELKAETEYGVMWSSTNKAVATVDHKGIVTAIAPGEATIVASLAGLGISAECKVTVVPKKFTVTWIVDDDKTAVAVNEGEEIIKPENPQKDGHIFKGWTPDVPDKMPSHDVEFTAVFVNCTKLEEALNKVPEDLSVYTSATRNVLEALIAECEKLENLNQSQVDELAEKIEKAISDLKLITITLSDEKITLTRGDVFKILAESELPVTWVSTNGDVAMVSEDGTVTAKGRGETTIIATVESLGISAECKVKVVPQKFTVTWNIDGAKIKVKLNEGDEIVRPEIPNSNFKGWTPEVPEIMPSENVEFTAVFEKAVVTSVKIKFKPTKLDYIYKTDNLDLTGLTLEVSYSDGTKEVVSDLSKAKVTGFDNTKLGTQTITIEYEGAKADFDITVSYAGWQYLILIFLLGFIWY